MAVQEYEVKIARSDVELTDENCLSVLATEKQISVLKAIAQKNDLLMQVNYDYTVV